MNKLAIGMLALLAFAIFVFSYAPKRAPGGDWPALQAPARAPESTGSTWVRAAARTISPSVISTDVDTTGLLRESLTIAELLDEVNGDSGDGFTPVDRERFAAELESDPQLRDIVSN